MDRLRLLVLLPGLVLSGCIALPIPHDRPLTPLYSGTVTDASTGQPIESASVTVTYVWRGYDHDDTDRSESKTDSSGRYKAQVVMKANWYVLFFGAADGSCDGSVTVSHPDYQSATRKTHEFRNAARDGSCTGVKPINMDFALNKMQH